MSVRRTGLSIPPCLLIALSLCACSGGGAAANGSGAALAAGAASLPAVAGVAARVPALSRIPSDSGAALTETPAQADSFVDAVGFDSHFNYPATPYVTHFTAVSAALIDAGVRHLRDGGINPSPAYASMLGTLGAAGITHSIGFGQNVTAAQITQALATQPYVDSVEPANELDDAAATIPNWFFLLETEQQLLYATVRSNPSNAGITVLGPALGHAQVYYLFPSDGFPSLDADSDAGNLHDSPCNLNPGTATNLSIAKFTDLIRASTTKPIWTTETGYNDDPVRPCSIPDDIIAKYDPRAVAERFLAGEPRVEFYQFVDMPSDPIFGGEGVLLATGRPKLQYFAIASMLKLLSDRGGAFEPHRLTFTLSGATQNLHHLLLQKRDGTYFLLLWLEVPSWAPVSASNIGGKIIPVTPQAVTLSIPTAYPPVTMYSYSSRFSLARLHLPSSAGSYALSVTDAIQYISFKSP